MPMRPLRSTLSVLWSVLLASGSLDAEVVTLGAVADTSLFGADPNDNYGGHGELPAGALGTFSDLALARALFKFDVAAAVPAGALIESARMTLTISSQVPEGREVSDFALSRVLVDWGEGSGTLREVPGGRPALAGEATWINRFHAATEGEGAIAWMEAGGEFGTDFAADQSATVENVNGSPAATATYIFDFNPTGLADLQGMLDGSFPNHGWVLYSLDEATPKTARRWLSRESTNTTRRPKLQITYSLPPPVPPVVIEVDLDPETQELLVRVEGRVGFRYELQGSDDLRDWTPAGVQVPTGPGELVFRIPLDPSTRFVRVEATLLPG